MKKKIAKAALLIFFIILAIFLPDLVRKNSLEQKAVVQAPKVAIGYEAKETSVGEVTIAVTPIELLPGKRPEFEVKFDTHSQELTFDVSKIASLWDDRGAVFKNPIWEGSPLGGHHREGKLVFQEPIGQEAKEAKLIFSGVSEGTVEFRWKILD